MNKIYIRIIIFKGTKNQILCAKNLGLCVSRTTVFHNIAKAIGIKFRNLEKALPSKGSICVVYKW